MSFYLPRDEKLDMQLYLVGSSNLNTTQIWKLFNINYRDRADSDVFPCFSPKSDLSYLFTSFIALDIVYCGICTSSTLKNCNCGICTSSTSKKLCIAASVQVVHWKNCVLVHLYKLSISILYFNHSPQNPDSFTCSHPFNYFFLCLINHVLFPISQL